MYSTPSGTLTLELMVSKIVGKFLLVISHIGYDIYKLIYACYMYVYAYMQLR